jgi:hypothetical protein
MDTLKMNTLTAYREVVENTLQDYVNIRYAYGDIKNELVVDREHDRFLVVSHGWEKKKRIHATLIHVDIIDGKVWIQQDGTEEGIAARLVEGGIPKERIVLAFHTPEMRQLTDFAVT